jgi:hypothetical protein
MYCDFWLPFLFFLLEFGMLHTYGVFLARELSILLHSQNIRGLWDTEYPNDWTHQQHSTAKIFILFGVADYQTPRLTNNISDSAQLFNH